MIDIETLDTRRTSLVLSIGWTLFDPYTRDDFNTLLENSECCYTSLESQRNGTFNNETLLFWLQKHPEELAKLLSQSTIPMQVALDKLTTVCLNKEPRCIWANSPQFDLAILAHHYKVSQQVPSRTPWEFYKERDVRTLLDVTGINKKKHQPAGFVAHRAEHDAAFQAYLVQLAYTNGR